MNKLFFILIVILIGFFTILPLFQKGFFPIHDDTQVARVYEMKVALQDGVFPVRIVPDLGYGYGYPIFNYYAPLGYYIGGFIALLSVPALTATKIMIGLGMVFSGISMYLLAQRFLSRESALIASALYLFAPYHAVNLYVRGAVSELFAYAFVPFAFYGLVRLFSQPTWFSVIVSSIGLAFVILSHNLTALMLLPFYGAAVMYSLFASRKEGKKKLLMLLVGPLLGIMLSAFYWLPALLEMGYTNVASLTTGGSVYKDHFVCLGQLWFSPWGFGGSTQGCIDGISFQLGKIHILLTLIGSVVLLFYPRRRKIFLIVLSGGLLSIFMLLRISQPVWDLFSPLHYLQFPWRYLLMTSFFLSLFGGYSIEYFYENGLKNKKQVWLRLSLSLVIILGIGFLYTKNFKPQNVITEYQDQTSRKELLFRISKISDEYLPSNFKKPQSEHQVALTPVISKASTIKLIQNDTDQLKALIVTKESAEVIVNKAVFPGWRFFINESPVIPTEKEGRYSVFVQKGESQLTVTYVSTTIQKIGNSISIVGFLILVLGIIIEREKTKKHAKTS